MTLSNTTVLPREYFNAVSLLTSGFLLFWFLWSFARFIDMIRIRVAIISNRLVPLRGISNYLMTMSEIVSSAHINAIIHTRQANPPKAIKSLYLPFSIDNMMISHGVTATGDMSSSLSDKTITIDLWVSGKCKVFIFFDFKSSRLKELLYMSPSNPAAGTLMNPTSDQFLSYLSNISSSPSYELVGRFVDYRICREVLQVGSLLEGSHEITFAIPRKFCDEASFTAGLMVITDSSSNSSKLQCIRQDRPDSHTTTTLSSSNENTIMTSFDIESQSPSESLNPLAKPKNNNYDQVNIKSSYTGAGASNKNRVSHHDNTNMEALSLAVCAMTGSLTPPSLSSSSSRDKVEHVVALPTNTSTPPSPSSKARAKVLSSPMTLSECFISGRNGTIYSAQEIFGWKASHTSMSASSTTSDTAADSSPAMTSSSSHHNTSSQNIAVDDGGGGIDDECVVCLTEKKDIALLPCRHLCICRQCLVQIDKCPVCRTGFDEYVAISSNDKTTMKIPYHKKSV